ncbi:MAG: GlcNAc-PI de-N-acetylase [Flammeovirgaceae bacterium]|nr:GlcNAc-PI de-N-acetylase [Flammeovirgaceae bacterium]|tara:strand:+ start:2186 stop:2866 length:681 start_codon:yes stop_codon:yes gene_type:complete
MNILVVAAHPDDEVLGCGGTMARLSSEGHNVHILILGEGVTSRHADPSDADQKELDALHKQAEEVGASLGAKEVSLAKLPDNRFDTVPLLDIIKIIEEHVARIKPEVVYVQHEGDLNIDHQCTFRAVLTATRPMEGSPVKQVLSYRVASSTEWAFGQFEPSFQPTVFSDISGTLDKKIAAMEVYEGEARPFPHPRSAKALRAEAEYFGSIAGLSAAEAFILIRQIQ